MALSVSLMQQPESMEAIGWQQCHPADAAFEGQPHAAESSNKQASGRQLKKGRGRFTQLEFWSSSESREELNWEQGADSAQQLAGLPKEAPQPATTTYTSQQASDSSSATAVSQLQSGSGDERSSCSWWPDQALVYRTGGWSLVNESAPSPAHRAPSRTLKLCSASLDEYQYDHSQVSPQPSNKQLADTGGWPEVEAGRQAIQPQRSAQPRRSQAHAHHAPWGPPPISLTADPYAQPQPRNSRDWMNACQARRNGKVHSCLKAACLDCPRTPRQFERGDWTAAFPQELERVKQKSLEQKAAGMHASARQGWSALSSASEQQYHEVSRLGMKLEEPGLLKAAGAASPGRWTIPLHAEHPWIR